MSMGDQFRHSIRDEQVVYEPNLAEAPLEDEDNNQGEGYESLSDGDNTIILDVRTAAKSLGNCMKPHPRRHNSWHVLWRHVVGATRGLGSRRLHLDWS